MLPIQFMMSTGLLSYFNVMAATGSCGCWPGLLIRLQEIHPASCMRSGALRTSVEDAKAKQSDHTQAS